MVITDKFVFIHEPKTGGTFVRHVLEQIHQQMTNPLLWRIWPKLAMKQAGCFRLGKRHDKCANIPAEHRHKIILGCVRNPYDRIVSLYQFRAWERKSPVPIENIRWVFPKFPNLSFEEYLNFRVHFMPLKNTKFPAGSEPGPQTWRFIKFFFREPRRVFTELDESYLAAKKWQQDIYPVEFLHTETLAADLHAFLLKAGYETGRIEFVRTAGKIFPREGDLRQGASWESHYTPELKAKVRRQERLLFEMFPEYDV
jgi:hypothetical protein